MMRVVFLWHMHQPPYRDALTGEVRLPWVRLHATRAYSDMAFLLERHPAIRCAVNWSGVLLEQLAESAAGEAPDRALRLAERPVASLGLHEREEILRDFFMASWPREVESRPRYAELLDRRGRDLSSVDLGAMIDRFGDQDLLDLEVLFHLAWCGFAAHEEEPIVAALDAKGRDFTEQEKAELLDATRRLVARVLPRWRALGERGQVELTITPHFHPILPLVIDTDSARRAMPDAALPPRFTWPEDARAHVDRAVDACRRAFGVTPSGVWPAEGSVSPEALGVLADAGVCWCASDEAVLLASLPPTADRSAALFRPWRFSTGAKAIDLFFRDHGLSDLIGFVYARNPADAAAADFVAHLENVGRTDSRAVVSVILDGENPWEHYEGSGRPFLESLYRRLADHPNVRTARPSEVLAESDPGVLHALHTGSWIDGNFRIWIGHPEDNLAWSLLGEARARFQARAAELPDEARARARDHLLAAEASDWFWWYGDDFETQNLGEFDALFRHRLLAAYRAMGDEPPERLLRPVARSVERAAAHSVRAPTALIHPRIDGETGSYFDWFGAGRCAVSGAAGSMARSSAPVAGLRYGFDLERLYLRFEPVPGAPLEGIELGIDITAGGARRSLAVAPRRGEFVPTTPEGTPVGRGRLGAVLELALPFADLGLQKNVHAGLAIRILRGGIELDRIPRAGVLLLTVPDENFERIHWQV